MDILEKKPAAAQERFEALLKIDPRNVDALMALTELKQRAGGSREELGVLITRAIEANPLHARPRLALIDLQLASGDLPAASSAAQNAVAALPTHAELQDRLARVLWLAGDTNHASSVFARLLAQSPDSYRGHLGLAELALARNDLDAAIHSAKRAYELAPEVLQVQRAALTVAMRRNRAQDAIAITRRMQQQHPDAAMGYIFEGEIQATLKQPDLAIAVLRKATELAEPAQAPGLLYSALEESRRTAEATKFAAAWLDKHPKDSLFLLYLGNAAMAQGDLALAESRFGQVLKDQPDNPVALNNAARVVMAQRKPGAVALAERAVKAAPGEAQLMDTLALALSSENQPAKAIELQKQVIEKAPQTPMYRLTLAKIYLQSGDKGRARAELEALLKPGPNFPGRDEAARLMQALGTS
jgi:putative PEP-CTERM system TPR-repeat lipoprotein